ncbi:hypothetical protein [Micromonospora sp. NPDC005161]
MTELPNGTEGTAEIAFDVPGWPPTKNEATSLLSAGHGHAGRVRTLLNAAGQAAARQRHAWLFGFASDRQTITEVISARFGGRVGMTRA